MELYQGKTIRAIKEETNFKISKSLGQNFLTDKGVIDDIVEGTFIGENDLVIEVGPGMGVLTQAAAEYARKVVAVEIDKNLIPILERTLEGYDNIEVINQDILKTDVKAIIEAEMAKDPAIENVRIMGNLPYYITTPIIMKILEEQVPAKSLTVMMQKEVGDRINAKPSSKAYGALTVMVQYYCDIAKVRDVSRGCFHPVPNVDSIVLRLDMREEKRVELVDEKCFVTCVKAGFSKRRKTILNCFTGLFGLDKDQMKAELEAAGINPSVRGETLTIDDYAVLANHFAAFAK